MEKRIWEIKKQELINEGCSDDNIDDFMIGTHPVTKSTVGLEGGKFFLVSYSFLGSVSFEILNLYITLLAWLIYTMKNFPYRL